MNGLSDREARKRSIRERLAHLVVTAPLLHARFMALRSFGAQVRIREYHLTNACNIRCKGCWFFTYGHDQGRREEKSLAAWEAFAGQQRHDRVNTALLIGGEPTLFLERIYAFVKTMRHVTISTNGLLKLPYDERFGQVGMLVSVFGGGPLDDDLRAIKPSGRPFRGLFDEALRNYRDDPRATFVFAVTETSVPYIDETVARIRDNGNRVTINFYSQYNTEHPLKLANERRLLDAVMEAKQRFPETILSHPEHIRGVITGRAWCGSFSGKSCPSISQSHPGNASRIANGHPYLPFFDTYKADLETLELCCTSGHCDGCRDSQAVFSWQLVNVEKALADLASTQIWVDVAEAYWSQFIWTPYHWSKRSGMADHDRGQGQWVAEELATT
jgi:organic radical activating enzyme